MPSPVVKITVADDSKRTKKVDGRVKEMNFNEHFYFSHPSINSEVFDSSKILIEVYDSHHTDKNSYLGVQEYDYATIYASSDHALHNQWLALSNIYSEENFTAIRGYLRLSIAVLHDDDPRVQLEFKDDSNGIVSTPPHVTSRYKQLSIQLFKAEDLPDMDSLTETKLNKKCDAFITVQYGGKSLASSVVKLKDNIVVWNENIMLPFVFPTTSEKIIIKVLDEDIGSNDIIGTIEINIHDVMNGIFASPHYFSIYGGPTTTSGKFTDLMNENAEIGSIWKGRVMMSLTAIETALPKIGLTRIDAKILPTISLKHLWILEFEIIDALFLPKEFKTVSFVVSYEATNISTPLRTPVHGNIYKWNLKRKNPFYCFSNKASDLSEVVVYICNGEFNGEKSRLCYQRINPLDLLDNTDIIVFCLLADPSIGKIKSSKILMRMKMKLSLTTDHSDKIYEQLKQVDFTADKPDINAPQIAPIIDNTKTAIPELKVPQVLPQPIPATAVKAPQKKPESSDSEDLDSMVSNLKKKPTTTIPVITNPIDAGKGKAQPQPTVPVQKQESIKKEESKPLIQPKPQPIIEVGHTVIANIHMSKNFVAGDATGTSDQFVELTIDGVALSTSVKYDQVNGSWNESLVFNNVTFDIKDESTWPIIFSRMMDKDAFQDEELGYAYIWLCSSNHKINSLEKITPKWQPFRLGMSNRVQGELLISFYILERESPNFVELTKKIPQINIYPETEDYIFKLNVIGLRKLEPLGILPVRRPYVLFDLNSIYFPTKENSDSSLKSVKTEPIYPGCNPTINVTFDFSFKLPKENIFMPSMTCMVYDKILFGLSNSLLGVFSLDLSYLSNLTRKAIQNDESINTEKIGIGLLTKLMGKKLDDMTLIERHVEDSERSELVSKQVEKPIEVLHNEEIDSTFGKIEESNVSDLRAASVQNMSIDDSILDVSSNDQRKLIVLDNKDKKESILNVKKEPISIKNNEIKGIEVAAEEKPHHKEHSHDKASTHECHNKHNQRKITEKVVVSPEYKEIEILVNNKVKVYQVEDILKVPDLTQFWELGYENPNKEKSSLGKHYRRFYNTELENEKSLEISSPFINIPIRREKFSDSLDLSDIFNQLRSKNKIYKRFEKNSLTGNYIEREMKEEADSESLAKVKQDQHGFFKGLIYIVEASKNQHYLTNIKNVKNLNPAMLHDYKNFNKFNDLNKELLIKREAVCRVYILELKDLAKKDLLSESDPYFKLSVNGIEVNEVDNHGDDTPNLSVYKHFE